MTKLTKDQFRSHVGTITGYVVSKRRQSRFDKRASPELEKVLGLPAAVCFHAGLRLR
jgi:hypothetical protein